MIPLRQHVASLVAVFLALAVGIALGGGPLSHGDEDSAAPTRSAVATPSAASDRQAQFADAFAGAAAGRLYAAGLTGHATAILVLPDAETSQVKEVQTQVIAAGGAITGTFDVSPKLLDASQKLLVDTTSAQLASQLADPRIEATVPTYERLGELVGVAMATTQPSSVRADPAAVSIRQSLGSAGLLTSPQDVRNGPLVLVVLPPGKDGPAAEPALRTALAGLVSGIAHNAAGVIVVGDEASAAGGELAALRASDLTGTISTVDGIETTIGQVTAVLAMEGVFAGRSGSYGVSGSDGVVPLQ